MSDPAPAIGNRPLNDSVSAITGVLGIVPGLSNVANLVNGLLGTGAAVNSIGTGNRVDEAVNGASIAAGGLGAMGTIANMAGINTGVSTMLGMTAATGEVAATTATGAAIGGAATVGSVAGAGAAGYGYGNMWNDYYERHALGGRDAEGRGRSLADVASDRGMRVHDSVAGGLDDYIGEGAADTAGLIAGGVSVAGESIYNTGRAIWNFPEVISEGLVNGIGGLF